MRQYYDSYWRQGKVREHDTQRLVQWTEQRKLELLLSLKELKLESLILDAGCGRGEFSTLMSQNGFHVIGIDIAEIPLSLSIKEINTENPILGYAVASVEGTLPFRNEFFSAVWSTEVIEHLLNVEETFQEFNRVLQIGGLLILTTPFHGVIKNLVLSLYGYDKHYSPIGPHIRFYTKKSLSNCLEKAGFVVQKMIGIGRYWPLWMSHFVVAQKVR